MENIRSKVLDMADIVKLMEVAFANEQKVILKIRGMSMFPFLTNLRDSVELSKDVSHLKKKDIILYRRKNGSYVLHRLLKIENDELFICGDNQHVIERGIFKEDVIARVTKLIVKNKEIDVNNKWYKFKVNVWCFNLFLRRVVLKIIHTLNKRTYLVD